MSTEFQPGDTMYWVDHIQVERSGRYQDTDGIWSVVDPDPPLVGDRRIQTRFLSRHRSLMTVKR
jgi:hypothetical protein